MRLPLAGLAGVLAIAAPFPVLAQQAFDLDEITVIANRVATEIQRSGASVSVIEREELERDGETSLGGVLNRLPGLNVTRSGGFGTAAQLTIRGAGPRYVAVYVDGVRVDDPTGITTEFDFGSLAIDDIERLEVLRGSQSALYGGSAVGGVVSVTTRRPQQDGFSQEAAVEGGSNNTFGGRYTLAFRDSRMETSVTLAHRRSDGFSAWEGALPRTPGLERDGFDMTRLSAYFRYQASEALAFGFSAFTQRTRAEYDGYGNPSADNESQRREWGGRAFAELDTGVTRHELSLSHYDITRRFNEGGAPAGWYEGDRTSLAYQGSTSVNEGLTLVWGADTTVDRGEYEASLAGRESMRTMGAFGQALWSPTAGLDIAATARVDRNRDFGTFTSGRISAAWQASDTLTVRGAVGRGFTAPSLNQRFGANFGATMVAPNPNLQPETSRSAELGVDWRSGDVSLGATVFRIDTDNAIEWCGAWADPCTFALPPGFTNAYQNIPGVTRRQGVELSASAPLNDRLTLGANYTYTDTRTPAGDQLTMVPRHVVNLSLDAILTDRLSGTVSARHVAGRAPQDDFLAGVSRRMPNYTLFDTSFRYAVNDHADVVLRVDNVFDRQYQEVWGYGTPGRSYYLGVAARF